MKTICSLLLLISVAFVFTGCESVTSLEPIGLAPVKITQEEWQGSWLVDDTGVLHTKVTNADEGELLLIIVNLDGPSDKDVLETYQVSIRKTGNNHYFNLIEKNDVGQEYYFAKFSRKENQIKVTFPSYDYFTKNISSGKVVGTVNKDAASAILKGNSAQVNDYIESHPEAFESDNVTVIKKLGN